MVYTPLINGTLLGRF